MPKKLTKRSLTHSEVSIVHIDAQQRLAGRDFLDTADTFVIFNVPIAVEMVQQYTDGYALKSSEEIKRIEVDQVPVTMRADEPSHPRNFMSMSGTSQRADVTVGYMSEPAKPELQKHDNKRYADYILYKIPKTQALIEAFKRGEIIDTSIGFRCENDETPGEFNGVPYDYVQRNIILDHNAILFTPDGRKGRGRAPSPLNGIGADSQDGDECMTDELKKQVDSLKADNEKLSKQVDELTKQLKDNDKNKTDAEMKTLQDENTQLKLDMDSLTKKHKEAEDKLQVFLDAENKKVEDMRAELIKKHPDFKDMLEKADAALVTKQFEKLNADEKKQGGKNPLFARMWGNDENNAQLMNEMKKSEKVDQYIEKVKKTQGTQA